MLPHEHEIQDIAVLNDPEAHLNELNYCVVVPTYNNAKTLAEVLNQILKITVNVIVVNDGSTDKTADILKSFTNIQSIEHIVNRGKGDALRSGFKKASALGFDYAITIDSDGQHFPEDIYKLLKAEAENKGAILVGARNLDKAGQPSRSSFANKLSNFWFIVETGIRLPDTQSGFRLYPLNAISDIKLRSMHYDFELEILVKSAWKGVPVLPVPVQVYYPDADERVSHFHPFFDFARISLLNVRLVILALFWYRPLFAICSFSFRNFRKSVALAFNNPAESIYTKCNSVALGVFFGIIPIWGYQLLTAILVAYLLKLNKTIVVLTAQISIPPMIPAILYLSVKTGEWVTGETVKFSLHHINLAAVKQQLSVYLIGSSVLSVIAAAASWIFAMAVIKLFSKRTIAV